MPINWTGFVSRDRYAVCAKPLVAEFQPISGLKIFVTNVYLDCSLVCKNFQKYFLKCRILQIGHSQVTAKTRGLSYKEIVILAI